MLGNLIERKATDMSRLLSNVLDLAKMELGQGALRAEWHAVEDFVSHALGCYQHVFQPLGMERRLVKNPKVIY